MGDAAQNCPACSAAMLRVAEPDIRYERCPSCGGIFLGPGGLNALATGMAGDIEFCSVDVGPEQNDVFPARACPRCPEQTMRKEGLLTYSGVIFDHCESCHAWFLDRGELRSMNDELAVIRRQEGDEAEERETRRGCLVTVTEHTVVTSTAVPLGGTACIPAVWREVSVYFPVPLGMGLRISRERWAARFFSLFGLHDIETGHEAFDRTFLVKADRGADVVGLLDETTRHLLLDFVNSEHATRGRKRSFEILDDRVCLAYTDDGDEAERPTGAQVEALTEALVDIAVGIARDPMTVA